MTAAAGTIVIFGQGLAGASTRHGPARARRASIQALRPRLERSSLLAEPRHGRLPCSRALSSCRPRTGPDGRGAAPNPHSSHPAAPRGQPPRGFVPWRFSNAGPEPGRAVAQGPASETLHRTRHWRLATSRTFDRSRRSDIRRPISDPQQVCFLALPISVEGRALPCSNGPVRELEVQGSRRWRSGKMSTLHRTLVTHCWRFLKCDPCSNVRCTRAALQDWGKSRIFSSLKGVYLHDYRGETEHEHPTTQQNTPAR